MPVKIPASLPARATLESENVFVMGEERAAHQDIRRDAGRDPESHADQGGHRNPAIAPDRQYCAASRRDALRTTTHEPRNASADHLLKHYCSFNEVRGERFDGLIITGGPIEHMDFEAVDYWPELTRILDWAAPRRGLNIQHLLGGAGRPLPLLRHTQISAARKTVWGI